MLCMPSISENKNGLVCLVISRTMTGSYAFCSARLVVWLRRTLLSNSAEWRPQVVACVTT